MMNDQQSFSIVSSLNQQGAQLQQAWEQQRQEWEQQRLLEKGNRSRKRKAVIPQINDGNANNNSNSTKEEQREKQQQQPHENWVFLGLWSALILLSYCRIRVEPLRRRRSDESTYDRSGGGRLVLSPQEQQRQVVRTLRRINRERQALGQEPISLDAYQAFQRVLVNDPSIWRGLAGRPHPVPPRGATPEQLQACPQRTLSSTHMMNNEDEEAQEALCWDQDDCSICLASYQSKDTLRSLPCGHSFHTDCIDRWLERSTLCPICKYSL
jgi:hypothetical protein